MNIFEIREKYFAEILIFLKKAVHISGISRIALIGSLTTDKSIPKDIDLLVNVKDNTDLTVLARLCRHLNGHVQSFDHNAEIFLANEENAYIGRLCHWKNCGPGIRKSCNALNCGKRHYLNDDLQIIALKQSLITNPPIELWPEIISGIRIEEDLDRFLIIPWSQYLSKGQNISRRS